MRTWFEEFMSRERRRVPRYLAPRLVGYYWDGGAPKAHCIRDISFTGLYLMTEQHWYPSTVVTMTLQRTEPGDAGAKRSIAVHMKVIRSEVDGVALVFLLPQPQDAQRVQDIVADGVGMPGLPDRKPLNRFLRLLLDKKA